MKIVLSFLIITLLFVFCRKVDNDTRDTQIPEDVKGMVYNNCTDSGLEKVEVSLQTLYKGYPSGKIYKVVSNKEGHFIFKNISVHTNSNYTYVLNIKTIGGDNSPIPSLARFDGATHYLSNKDIRSFHTLRVTPGFFRLHSNFRSKLLDPKDSLMATFTQKIFSKNVPHLPAAFYSGGKGMSADGTLTASNFPMGFYTIKIDKWRQGIHTVINDSLYLGWSDEKTYSMDW